MENDDARERKRRPSDVADILVGGMLASAGCMQYIVAGSEACVGGAHGISLEKEGPVAYEVLLSMTGSTAA